MGVLSLRNNMKASQTPHNPLRNLHTTWIYKKTKRKTMIKAYLARFELQSRLGKKCSSNPTSNGWLLQALQESFTPPPRFDKIPLKNTFSHT